jgi:C1A family cysteine protease
MSHKKKLFLGFVVVALLTIFVAAPSQAFNNKFVADRSEKQAKIQLEIEEMRAEIASNGYTFTVGPNPAMQYSLEQLCTFRPDLPLPAMHLREAMSTLPDRALADLPAAYTGYYTSIKDQGSCGSCWAFAAVGLLESMILKNDNVEVDLSEQYMLSCNPWGWGCNGGYWPNDMLVDPGAALESSFPYVASDAPCISCSTPYQIQSWAFVTQDNEVPDTQLIKQAIYTYGAVQAGIYVERYFQMYTGGVLNKCKRRVNWTNHAIILCGWDDSKGAWLLKNSWGTGWGENGFMWVAYGCNLVGEGANYFIY